MMLKFLLFFQDYLKKKQNMRIVQIRRNRVIHLMVGAGCLLLLFYFMYLMPHAKMRRYWAESLKGFSSKDVSKTFNKL